MSPQRLATAAVVMAAGLSVAACTSPRDTLGTNSGRCFRALALARDAVGSRGDYAGVRYLPARSPSRSRRSSRRRHRRRSLARATQCAP